MTCRICGNSHNNTQYVVREMMFGFRDKFTYLECSTCGCLQLAETPGNMEKYYPSGYYSFQQPAPESAIRRFARVRRDRHAVFGSGLMGKLLFKRYPNSAMEILGANSPDRGASILDVGCGSGAFLCTLRDLGFKSLFGVDPYIAGDVATGPVRILKKTILDLPDSEKFDFVFFNHSLEHIWNQAATLSKASRLLTAKGFCVIGMPLKTDTIWNQYGINWVHIDAPRHFYLHTMTSFRHLGRQAGLAIKDVIFDSTERQFWGSEQYKNDIPLKAETSYGVNPKRSVFTAAQIRLFRERARELNRIEQGDQATFCLITDTKSQHRT